MVETGLSLMLLLSEVDIYPKICLKFLKSVYKSEYKMCLDILSIPSTIEVNTYSINSEFH